MSNKKQSTSTPPQRGRFARLIRDGLRKRRRQSLVEIDESNKHYALTSCMQEGLTWVSEAMMDFEKGDLKPEDFSEVIKGYIQNELDEPFLFKSYAPKVFLCMRRNLDISDDCYLESLKPTNTTKSNQVFLKFNSNSKGGQKFFMNNDKSYMIKTEKKSDVEHFLKILPKYFQHMERYPHSLIVRYLGLHYIKIKGEKELYFTVMQSVFHPDERITTRYDLKGCTANRFENPDLYDGANVLKDNNLGKQTIKLGPQRDWLCQQTQIDCGFMEELGVMDYSLLMGEHVLHPSEVEQNNKSMAEVVLRVAKSFKSKLNSKRTPLANNLPPDTSINLDLVQSDHTDNIRTTPTAHKPHNPVRQNEDAQNNPDSYGDLDHSIIPGVTITRSNSTASLINQSGQSSAIRHNHLNELQVQNTSRLDDLELEDMSDTSSYNGSIQDQNLRYLPNVDNAWHVIDGPTHRYYVGIVDLFTVYSVRKRCEHVMKAIWFPTESFSTVNPQHYSKRFQQFVIEHCE